MTKWPAALITVALSASAQSPEIIYQANRVREAAYSHPDVRRFCEAYPSLTTRVTIGSLRVLVECDEWQKWRTIVGRSAE